MRKQIIEYTSPPDALIALAKQLSIYEAEHRMESEEFFTKYNQGEISADEEFVARDCNRLHKTRHHQRFTRSIRVAEVKGWNSVSLTPSPIA